MSVHLYPDVWLLQTVLRLLLIQIMSPSATESPTTPLWNLNSEAKWSVLDSGLKRTQVSEEASLKDFESGSTDQRSWSVLDSKVLNAADNRIKKDLDSGNTAFMEGKDERAGEVDSRGSGEVGKRSSAKSRKGTRKRPSASRSETAEEVSRKISAIIPGDIMIGGLFPVHNKGVRAACGQIQADRGIQRLEAMLFAIDRINRDKRLLRDVKLGANIMDTCSRDTHALEQSLDYVRASLSSLDAGSYVCADGSEAVATNSPVPVVGVIGGSYSTVSIQVANLFRLFRIPQISYASTSAALSDKTRFDYFARTVPPDNYQAKAIADIVGYFNWTYVSTVASEGNYGEMGIESFKHEATLRNICIAVHRKIVQNADDADFDAVIDELLKESTARVVVLFLRVEDASNLLLAASRRHNDTDHFVWIASDGWGSQDMPVRNKEHVAEGALTIELQSTRLEPFDRYFMSLSPQTNARNPWFAEYWEHTFGCRLSDEHRRLAASGPGSGSGNDTAIGDWAAGADVRPCTGKESISPAVYKQETKIQFVYDAVYALAHALDAMFADRCGQYRGRRNRKRCILEMRIDGKSLFNDYLLNVSFNDGYGALVEFDERGDGSGRYDVLNYRRSRARRQYEYVKVGQWNSGLQMSDADRILWAGGSNELPRSQCSLPCGAGQVRHGDSHTCCWVCITCQPWQYVRDAFTCEDCDAGWWPTDDKATCFRLAEQYVDWLSAYALVPVCLSLAGIALTSVVIVTFLRHIDTPIVKASGRELSFMLLSGFLICFGMTFVLLLKPSAPVCALQRFGVGFGFSVTYSALFTKTNRISRIFDSASRSAKRPPFISPRSQVVISLLLISVQVICNGVWLVLQPPGTRHFHPFGRRDEIVLKCRIRDESFLISLVYNMLLIIICTVYAVKTRKIPENFNESKFIGFTMYTTCIIWLAFVPIYFGTLNSFQIQITTLCISISLSAFVALLCLFTPKMYIIIWQPEKNVRRLTMNSGNYKKTMPASVSNSNHAGQSEHIKMNSQLTPLRQDCTTTDTDKDMDINSLDSLSDPEQNVHTDKM